MAPSKAVAWPQSVYDDADVQSLDEQGRFIICRVCAENFAAFGGKTPRPVTMNACFRMRAWETHKRRTRAHRKTRSISPPRSRLALRNSDLSAQSSDTKDRNALASVFLQQAAEARSSEMREFNRQYAHFTDDLAITGCYGTRPVLPIDDANRVQRLLAPRKAEVQQLSSPSENQDVPMSGSEERRSHGLSCLLNPWAAALKHDDSKSHQQRNPAKRQRSAGCEADSRSVNTGRSASHALYWKTMRELFSADSVTNSSEQDENTRRSQSLSGSTDEDGWNH